MFYSKLVEASLSLSWHDYIALLAATTALRSWLIFYVFPAKREPGFEQLFLSPQVTAGLSKGKEGKKSEVTRNIAAKFKDSDLDIIILWGSQSGQGERMAQNLAQELRFRLGINAIADDLDHYDHRHMKSINRKHIVGFLLATYGEGDPTDNAVEFERYLSSVTQDRGRAFKALAGMKYFAFGLGSSKYQYYNRFVDTADQLLRKAGATRIGPVGKKDDSAKDENAWINWKKEIIPEVSAFMGKKAIEMQSDFRMQAEIKLVEFGTEAAREMKSTSPGISKGGLVTMASSKCLSQIDEGKSETNYMYLHVELDTKNTSLGGFMAGDHLSLWPMNTDCEVERLARQFGWDNSILDSVVRIDKLSGFQGGGSTLPITPTTRRDLLQYYLDICGALSKDLVNMLIRFAPSEIAKARLEGLIHDEMVWKSKVFEPHLTVAGAMELACLDCGNIWPPIVFLLLLQLAPIVRPRHFSIASSPLDEKNSLALTVSVLKTQLPNGKTFFGLASNFMYHLHNLKTKSPPLEPPQPTYTVANRELRFQADECQLIALIRRSTFRLPAQSQRPIIMIAAGSGIAPFRGFVQERAALARNGVNVGSSLLFFGCRSASTDYLYHDEWESLREESWFMTYVAFSRGPEKRYIQDELRYHCHEVSELLIKQEAHLYICGSLKMAKDVKETLASMLDALVTQQGGGHSFIDTMKSSRRLQEDVWE